MDRVARDALVRLNALLVARGAPPLDAWPPGTPERNPVVAAWEHQDGVVDVRWRFGALRWWTPHGRYVVQTTEPKLQDFIDRWRQGAYRQDGLGP